ncbi:MAG: hypothetical protein HUU34_07520 [Saprospiraceae bacterium]|jgi:hypothetical protein|nr:hypothetical protein [Saprospiraceae bacterium]
MKPIIYMLTLIIALTAASNVAYGFAGMTACGAEAAAGADAGQSRRVLKAQKKWQKLKQRLEKLPRKLGEVWDDGKFRIGVILLGAALILALVSIIISLGGLVDLIAGVLALGGIVLIIWGLVTAYG